MRFFLLALALTAPAAARADDAAEQVRRLEALAGLTDLKPGWVSPAAAAAYCASSPMTVVTAPDRDRQLVYACRAFVAADAAPCRAMPGAYISRNTENCLTSFAELATFIHFTAPGPESLRRCEAGFGLVNPKLTQPERVASCAALARERDAAARCRAFRESVPRVFEGIDFADCLAMMSYAQDGSGCEGYHPGTNQRVVCASFAAYRKASCGGDYLCRALRGEAGACETGRAALVAAACVPAAFAGAKAGRAAPAAAEPLRREVDETLAWAVHLPVLDLAGRDALARLHDMMMGRRELDPATALADLATLRYGAVDDLLHRADASAGSAELRRRAEAAQARALLPPGEAVVRAKAEQETFVRCLEAAERPAASLDEAAPSAAASAACRSGCSMETVMADHGLKARMSSDVVLRQVCRAVALGTPQPCDVLADIQGKPESGDRMCRRLYQMSLLSRSLLGGKPDAARCEAWCALAPAPPPAELVGKVCASVDKRDYVQACSDIEQWKTTPDHGYNVRECHWEMRALLGDGDEEFCGGHYRPGSDVCLALGLYKKSTGCERSPLCRAMRGDGPGACAPLDASILRQARVLSAAPAEERADPNAAQESVRLAEDCARSRSRVWRLLDAAREPALVSRQKNVEEAFQLRGGISSSHSAAAPASYTGGWTFYLGQDRSGVNITVDRNGRFLVFAGKSSYAGVVNLASGELSGLSVEPDGREGKLAGRCTSFTACSGDGFRLAR